MAAAQDLQPFPCEATQRHTQLHSGSSATRTPVRPLPQLPSSSTIYAQILRLPSSTQQTEKKIVRIPWPKLRRGFVGRLIDAALTRPLRSLRDHGVSRSSSRPPLLPRLRVPVRRRCSIRGGRRRLPVRARGGAHASEGPSRRAEVLHRRLEHQQRALLGLGGLQRGAGLRGGRNLVRRVRRRPLPRRLLLLLLPQPQHLLLPRGLGHLARAAPRLHGRRRRGVRRPVRRAGPLRRQHVGDGRLRGEAVQRHGGQPADLHGVPAGGEGGGRGASLAARRPQGEDRRRRAQGGLRLRRARRPHRQQLRQDPRWPQHNNEDSDCSRSRDANPCRCWSCVLGVRIGVASLRVGVSCVDYGRGNVCDVRYFPSAAQRGRGHVRGDGRVGAAPAGAHGAGRHPPLRRHRRDHGGAGPGQGGELPPRRRAQRRHLQRVQRRLPAGGAALAAALLQPVRPARAAALQPVHAGPPRPRLRPRRGRRPRRRAAGVGGPRVPDHCRRVWGGVRDGRPRDAVDAGPDGRRRQRELRAVPVRAGAGRPGRLHVRAPRVPVRRRGPLPRARQVQRAGLPGPPRRRGRRAALGAALGRALEGEAEEERRQGDGARSTVPAAAALQARTPPAPGGEGAPAQPEKAVHVSVISLEKQRLPGLCFCNLLRN